MIVSKHEKQIKHKIAILCSGHMNHIGFQCQIQRSYLNNRIAYLNKKQKSSYKG